LGAEKGPGPDPKDLIWLMPAEGDDRLKVVPGPVLKTSPSVLGKGRFCFAVAAGRVAIYQNYFSQEGVRLVLARVLTIAGSDSGGGAGIQADLKTFSAFGVYGMTVITALTAQNTLGVQKVQVVEAEMVGAQIDAVVEDIGVDAAKTGMLANAEIIELVADKIAEHRLERLVVDPVMVAKGGHPLLEKDAISVMRRKLLPQTLVLTPNLPEAEVLVGKRLETEDEVMEAARVLADMGPRVVVIKGGHFRHEAAAVDLVYLDGSLRKLTAPRYKTRNTHGTGCTFSAAVAAELGKGSDVETALGLAKAFITRAISEALDLGSGYGPTNHMVGTEDLKPNVYWEEV